MSRSFEAYFAGGVLHPLEPLELSENVHVRCAIEATEVAQAVRAGSEFKTPVVDAFATQLLTILRHELLTPVTAVRSAIAMARHELRDHPPMRYPYLEDAETWLELMVRLLDASDLRSKQLHVERVHLFKDVIAPSVRHVQALLRERSFDTRGIEYGIAGNWKSIPPLHVDRQQFSQVFFNLLSNAIKYSFRDPAAFHVRIIGEAAHGNYLVRVADWGIGITPDSVGRIFEPGFRDERASNLASGCGLGLAVARQIMLQHGGDLQLTSSHMPTEFTMSLPKSISLPPTPGD